MYKSLRENSRSLIVSNITNMLVNMINIRQKHIWRTTKHQPVLLYQNVTTTLVYREKSSTTLSKKLVQHLCLTESQNKHPHLTKIKESNSNPTENHTKELKLQIKQQAIFKQLQDSLPSHHQVKFKQNRVCQNC